MQPGDPDRNREGANNEGIGNLARSQAGGVTRDTRREEQAHEQIKGEMRPARDRGTRKLEQPEPFAGRGTVEPPASNIGGVSGRPMNRRSDPADIDEDDVAEASNEGASSGTNRTPKILQKNRKSKRAA